MSALPTTPSFYFDLQVSKYFNVAGLVVWVFDYCVSLDAEVHWIWQRQWNFARVVFTAARYIPCVGAIMTVINANAEQTGNCKPFEISSNLIHVLGILSAEGLLAVRTYALWQGNKKVLAGILVFGLFSIGGSISVPYWKSSSRSSCLFLGDTTYAIQYGFVLFFELFLLITTALASFRHYRFVKGLLITILIRDGVMYMGCIISVTIINIIVNIAVPLGYTNSLDALQLVLHSVLASRIFFHLRESYVGGVIEMSSFSVPTSGLGESTLPT
ncbi:hypothetical protein SERLA73DRAFT_174991 [Serpula lacrymans var. lacrymans S7.3]|uniref:DUF6533 domain-containing protein n=2 Tax=Serpula lacrymans var. lacrymans TaxID=341189 RepID=F8PJT0_SERL3|nr:uncharacterized protein SERLADRAFT_456758 [Serpula lacrymans var. lacrymans S7.9]EGO03490.1 hypothetical protein SERLA73DRAFT_174991 [Serpula lacrymans var. lacrymans S7.3]EGO29243.1 hypothetical protein SERLADRAFT_456758 [Serpula lacrymans var. lacrymans S7.9]